MATIAYLFTPMAAVASAIIANENKEPAIFASSLPVTIGDVSI
jgi:hypothetical protein